MKYFLESKDSDLVEKYERLLEEEGYEVVDEYSSSDTVLVSFGGDGSVLYNSWNYDEPTILPVVTEKSEGNKAEIGVDGVVDAVERIERGDYEIEEYGQLSAYDSEGNELRGDFRALGEINLHHSIPVEAAIFDVQVLEGSREVLSVDRVIGDGLIVSTPFGSTGYFFSIARTTFDEGIGVAFNNVHKPRDLDRYIVVGEDAEVEIEIPESFNPEHSSNAILARDNDKEYYVPEPGEKTVVRMSEYTVKIVRLDA